jgi:putative hydrolase of the HAD superfamily
MTDLGALVRGVRLLSLDAGNTVIFLDHARLAALAARQGFTTDAATLVRTEGAAKRRHARGDMVQVSWASELEPGARGWGAMVATTVAEAGFPAAKLKPFLEDAWREHVQKNLWWLVPDGFSAAMARVRARGVKVVLVSNSEGMLDRLFAELGILGDFDRLLDSGKVGFEKPDPRIFRLALDAYGVAPDLALHLGDMYSTDITGARAAGMRAALVDPHGHYDGMFPDVPRVPGVVAVADAIAPA